jgi:hypothetical protein
MVPIHAPQRWRRSHIASPVTMFVVDIQNSIVVGVRNVVAIHPAIERRGRDTDLVVPESLVRRLLEGKLPRCA